MAVSELLTGLEITKICCFGKDLFWFYGISTIVGYLMPNPIFTYRSDIYYL